MPNYGTVSTTPVYGAVPPVDTDQFSPSSTVTLELDAPASFTWAHSGPKLVLASWFKRAVGGIVDWLPMVVLSVVGSVIGTWWLESLLSLVGGLYGLFNIGVLGGSTGASLGRMAAGTKLVREETLQPIGAGMGIGRYFLHILDVVILCVGFLFPLWTKKRQTIADMLMKTIVIENAQSQY